MEVDLRARASLSSRPREPRPRNPSPGELGIVESGILIDSLLFTMVLLSCAIALLGIENLFSLLRIVELHRKFFHQVAILKRNRAKKRKF